MKRATLVVSALLGCIATSLPATGIAQAPQSQHRPPTITEAALHYLTANGQSKILRIDPGHVDLMFFDQSSRDTYFEGLQEKAPTPREITVDQLVKADSQFFRDVVDDSAKGKSFPLWVTLHANGHWYRLSDVAEVRAIVLRYHSPDQKEFYALKLPLRPTNTRDAVSDVDVVFWNMKAYNDFRSGMEAAGTKLNVPRISDLKGKYKFPVPDGGDGFHTEARYLPKPVIGPGAFHSTDSEICYHFENCQWVCTGN